MLSSKCPQHLIMRRHNETHRHTDKPRAIGRHANREGKTISIRWCRRRQSICRRGNGLYLVFQFGIAAQINGTGEITPTEGCWQINETRKVLSGNGRKWKSSLNWKLFSHLPTTSQLLKILSNATAHANMLSLLFLFLCVCLFRCLSASIFLAMSLSVQLFLLYIFIHSFIHSFIHYAYLYNVPSRWDITKSASVCPWLLRGAI